MLLRCPRPYAPRGSASSVAVRGHHGGHAVVSATRCGGRCVRRACGCQRCKQRRSHAAHAHAHSRAEPENPPSPGRTIPPHHRPSTAAVALLLHCLAKAASWLRAMSRMIKQAALRREAKSVLVETVRRERAGSRAGAPQGIRQIREVTGLQRGLGEIRPSDPAFSPFAGVAAASFTSRFSEFRLLRVFRRGEEKQEVLRHRTHAMAVRGRATPPPPYFQAP